MTKIDILVVGSGPAGATVARYLAKNGFNILVLEGRKTDWDKPCAGGITHRVFDEFGVSRKIIERPLSKLTLVSPTNEIVKAKVSRLGGLVLRPKFDKYLSDLAIDSGAELKENTWVTEPIVKNGAVMGVIAKAGGIKKEYEANIVIAADGTPSVFAKYFNLYRKDFNHLAITFQYQMEMKEEIINELFDDGIDVYFGSKWIEGGYTWVFPKRNVLAVGNGTWAHLVKKYRLNLKLLLDTFLKTHPIAKEKLKDAKIKYSHGAPIGFPRILKRRYGNGFLIIGDAGGFVSYATAEGIYYSMKSGKLAAEFIKEMHDSGKLSKNNLMHFETYIKDLLQDLYAAVKVRKMLLDTDKKQRKVVHAAKVDSWFNRMVCDVVLGNIEYRAFLRSLYMHPHKLLKALLFY